MKKAKWTSRYLRAGLLAASIGPLLAHAPAFAHGQADRIAGLWLVKVTLTNCATGAPLPFPGAKFDAMALFGADGTMHDTNTNSPLVRSPAFGTWKHLDGRRYKFAFRHFNFDSTGTLPTGANIVRHKLTLSADGKSYASKGTAEFYDVNGIRMLPDGCSISTATRFR
jgi:hypothetical protein